MKVSARLSRSAQSHRATRPVTWTISQPRRAAPKKRAVDAQSALTSSSALPLTGVLMVRTL
jgi:hypothetical protein